MERVTRLAGRELSTGAIPNGPTLVTHQGTLCLLLARSGEVCLAGIASAVAEGRAGEEGGHAVGAAAFIDRLPPGPEARPGAAIRICRTDAEQAEVVIDFEGREVAYDYGELDAVVPAYATTVHKAQGSEYPAVVIPVVTQHWGMLRRNLVYTAVTRGKRLVVIVGQPKALALAVKGTQARRRWSKLGEWLGGGHRVVRRAAAETVG